MRLALLSFSVFSLILCPNTTAQEYSEREAHVLNAWARYVAETEAGKSPEEIDIDPYTFKISDEALNRKQRSNEILVAADIPVSNTLPVIETVAQSIRRTETQIAERITALMIQIAYSETSDQGFAQALIAQHGAEDFLTEMEMAYLSNPEPSQQENINAAWRYEAVNVLMWSLGFLDTMGPANDICDVNAIVDVFLSNPGEALSQKAKLRPQSELLDAADLVYRQRWADVEASLSGLDLSAKLNSSVLLERHYALNWLVGYLNQDWDNVSTDT